MFFLFIYGTVVESGIHICGIHCIVLIGDIHMDRIDSGTRWVGGGHCLSQTHLCCCSISKMKKQSKLKNTQNWLLLFLFVGLYTIFTCFAYRE